MRGFVQCYIQSVMHFTVSDKLIRDSLRYMRVPPDSHDDELINTVREAFSKLENFIMPRFVYGRFPIVHLMEESSWPELIFTVKILRV